MGNIKNYLNNDYMKIFLIIILMFLLLVLYYLIIKPMPSSLNSNSNYLLEVNNPNSNLSICDKIKNKEQKNSCIITNTQCFDDKCYYDKGRLTKNELDCFKINDENLRISCSSGIKIDSLIQNAVLKDDINLCLNIEDENLKLSCTNNYYYAKKMNLKNVSYCDKINNENLKNECYTN